MKIDCPKTGYSHPKCFASALQDCSTQISAEHYISRSVLEIIAPDGIVALELPIFKAGEKKLLSIDNVTANILCQKHNNSLHDLDTLAKNVFGHLMGKSVSENLLSVNVSDFERWLLKLLCGVGCSRVMGPRFKYASLPIGWLETLFGSRPFPNGYGFCFVTGEKHDTFHAPQRHILVSTLFTPSVGPMLKDHNHGSVTGCVFEISAFKFMLKMSPEEIPPLVRIAERTVLHYRPERILITDSQSTREINFGVTGGSSISGIANFHLDS